MNWDQYQIVKCISPNSQVLSPSFHGPTALTWFHTYVTTSITVPSLNPGVNNYPSSCPVVASQVITGKQTFDIPNVHDHFASPEAFIAVYNNTVTEINNDGLPQLIFNDESGCNGIAQCVNYDTLASIVATQYVLRAALGPPYIITSNYYQWDSNITGIGTALQGSIAGLAFDVTYGWLVGNSVSNYILSGTTYTVPVTLSNGTTGIIVWDSSKNCISGCTVGNQTFGSQYTFYYDITGTSYPTSGGVGTAPVGLKPIFLIANSSPPPTPPTNLQITTGTKINNALIN